MLDRLFLSKLSSTGKVAYWIGQISLILIWALIVFGFMGMSFDDGGEGMLFIGMIVIVLIWGVLCMAIWPVDKELDAEIDEVIEKEMEQVKVLEEEVRE